MDEHFARIYQHQAEDYDQLVDKEDHEHNLRQRLLDLLAPGDWQEREVVELGAGTGRLTRLLSPLVGRLRAFDASAAMLEVARRRHDPRADHVEFAIAAHHQIPLDDAVADVAIEGWSFGHLAEGLPPSQGADAVRRAMDEMTRLVRPGGMLVLIETLGTGQTTPAPPAPFLDRLYQDLEHQGFARQWCRTDYAFASLPQARRLITFFFGASMVEHLDPQTLILPECTGIWHRTRS
ncbi:MAG: methyltransferase domain-containing protein [Myxococcota bacterium]